MKPPVRGPVLVVEDDPDQLQSLVELLSMRFFHVVGAENGLAALEMVRRHHPCLVILDLGLPLLDGRSFVEIVQNDPEFPRVPVICVSGQPHAVETARRLGVPCFQKPINPEPFLEAVVRYCQLG